MFVKNCSYKGTLQSSRVLKKFKLLPLIGCILEGLMEIGEASVMKRTLVA